MSLGQIHGFINRGVFRNPIKKINLVESDPEKISDERIGFFKRAARKLFQIDNLSCLASARFHRRFQLIKIGLYLKRCLSGVPDPRECRRKLYQCRL